MIGIYLLKFTGTDKVYIGKSMDITKRFISHKFNLRKGLGAKKLQEAYNIYGEPEIEIVQECLEEDLNKYEELLIAEYNSVIDGFNTHEIVSGKHKGTSAKDLGIVYPTIVSPIGVEYNIENAKKFARDHSLSYVYLNKVLNKHLPHIQGWYLKENLHLKKPIPVVTNGQVEVEVPNITKFAREYGLIPSNINGVINGKRKSHKGWVLKSFSST